MGTVTVLEFIIISATQVFCFFMGIAYHWAGIKQARRGRRPKNDEEQA